MSCAIAGGIARGMILRLEDRTGLVGSVGGDGDGGRVSFSGGVF